jgi:hypothetical protein
MLSIVLFASSLNAQNGVQRLLTPADDFNKQRFTAVGIAGGLVFTGAMVGLYSLWYKKYPKQKFHLFNDSKEWKQIDKLGHAITSYIVTRSLTNLFNWTGVNPETSMWLSVGGSQLFMSTVEIMDGHSENWGFSVSDIVANMSGAALYVGQQYLWNEQRVTMKVGFRKSMYAKYRPNILGENLPQQIIKDYNALSFWLSVNPRSFMSENSNFPHWLSVSLGYGANGMIGGHENPELFDLEGKPIKFERYRQWFLAPDVDLWRIPQNNREFNTLFEGLHFVKIPTPSLEFNRIQKVRFNPLLIRH